MDLGSVSAVDHGLNGDAENGTVQNNNHVEGDEKGKGNKSPGSGNSSLGVPNPEASSPSPAVTRKGFGLRKWKRIDRNSAKSSGGVDATKFTNEERSNSGANPSKRMQVYIEKESRENSISSTNAKIKSLEGFSLPGEAVLVPEEPFGAGTDSDNSEDRSSKSSTAASGPVGSGFPHDNSRLRTSKGQHGKSRVETMKKPREGLVKGLKEAASISSLESDSCSPNFVFMPEKSSVSNGIRGEKLFDGGDGGNDTEVERNHVDEGDRGRSRKEGYDNVSHENGAKVKVDRKDVNGFSTDRDPLIEAIDSLQYAQEALEKEMLKFREISKHVEDFISDEAKAEDDEQNLQETVVSGNEEVEEEIELLLMNKIEAEVEYLTISSTLRNMQEDALASAVAEKLTETRNKALMLKNKAEEFEKVCEEVLASAEESSTEICKYASYFFLQMLLLFFVFTFFMLKSQSYEDVVAT